MHDVYLTVRDGGKRADTVFIAESDLLPQEILENHITNRCSAYLKVSNMRVSSEVNWILFDNPKCNRYLIASEQNNHRAMIMIGHT